MRILQRRWQLALCIEAFIVLYLWYSVSEYIRDTITNEYPSPSQRGFILEFESHLWELRLMVTIAALIETGSQLFAAFSSKCPWSSSAIHGLTSSAGCIPLVMLSLIPAISNDYGKQSERSMEYSQQIGSVLMWTVLVTSEMFICFIVLTRLLSIREHVAGACTIAVVAIGIHKFTGSNSWSTPMNAVVMLCVFITCAVFAKVQHVDTSIGALTWREALIVTQIGLVLLSWAITYVTTSGTSIDSVELPAYAFDSLHVLTELICLILSSSASSVILAWPILQLYAVPNHVNRCRTKASAQRYRSTFFLTLVLFVVCFGEYMLFRRTLHQEPCVWMFKYFTSTPVRKCTILYWVGCVLALLLVAQILKSRERTRGSTWVPNIVLRKLFHFIAAAMFIPIVVLDHQFMQLSFAVSTQVLIFLELLRAIRAPYIGDMLHKFMSQFIDARDAGYGILTHLYLLVGCAAPVWLTSIAAGLACTSDQCVECIQNMVPSKATFSLTDGEESVRNLNAWLCLASSAGILSIGVGDATAAIVGSLFGRMTWGSVAGQRCEPPNDGQVLKISAKCSTSQQQQYRRQRSNSELHANTILQKTVEGTFASKLSMLLVALLSLVALSALPQMFRNRINSHAYLESSNTNNVLQHVHTQYDLILCQRNCTSISEFEQKYNVREANTQSNGKVPSPVLRHNSFEEELTFTKMVSLLCNQLGFGVMQLKQKATNVTRPLVWSIMLQWAAWLAFFETATGTVDNLVMPLYAWAALFVPLRVALVG